jgi:hypothetical protein
MLIADINPDLNSAPMDPFKTVHLYKKKGNDITSKVNETATALSSTNRLMTTGADIGFDGPKKSINSYRFTSIEHKYPRKGKRLFEETGQPRPPYRADDDPLPSSFSKTGWFVPPPSAKEA